MEILMKTKMITKTIANIAALMMVGTGIASAGAGPWSPWFNAGGDADVEYRYKVTTYDGSYLTPSCDVEVRDLGSDTTRIQGVFSLAGNAIQGETTRTFWLSSYSRTGSDAISSCGYVTDFQVTSVR
jgi:hypothetical protein